MMNKYLKSELTKVQVESVEVLPKYKRYILGDITGMGKTYSILAAFAEMKVKDNSLHLHIVCPKNAVSSWENELGIRTDFKYSIRVDSFPCFSSYDSVHGEVTLHTYESLKKDLDYLKVLYHRSVIVMAIDEAHRIKNPTSQRTQLVRYYMSLSKVAWGLTATYLLNDVVGLWGLWESFFPGYFGSKESFLRTYTIREDRYLWITKKLKSGVKKERKKIKEIVDYQNLDLLKERVGLLVLRRGQEFNIKYHEIVSVMSWDEEDRYLKVATGFIEGSPDEKSFSSRLPELQLVVDNSIDDKGDPNRGEEFSSKEESFINLVHHVLSQGEGLIIYSSLLKSVDRIVLNLRRYRDYLKAYSDEALFRELFVLTGATSFKERGRIQKDHGPGTIIVMTDAGSQSINLQKVSNFLFYNLPYKIEHFIQGIGRIVRMDSTYPHFDIFMLVAKDTIDTYKSEKILHRIALIDKVVAGKSNMPKGKLLSAGEIKDMKKNLLWRCGEWKKSS